MAEQLLHHAQVGPALEQVGRRAVPEAMGAEVRCVGNVGEEGVDDLADLPLVRPAAPATEEQGGPAARSG